LFEVEGAQGIEGPDAGFLVERRAAYARGGASVCDADKFQVGGACDGGWELWIMLVGLLTDGQEGQGKRTSPPVGTACPTAANFAGSAGSIANMESELDPALTANRLLPTTLTAA
jgi:hypothetical protein